MYRLNYKDRNMHQSTNQISWFIFWSCLFDVLWLVFKILLLLLSFGFLLLLFVVFFCFCFVLLGFAVVVLAFFRGKNPYTYLKEEPKGSVPAVISGEP